MRGGHGPGLILTSLSPKGRWKAALEGFGAMMAGRHDSINRQIPSSVSSKRGCKAALNGSRVTRRQRFIAVSRRHAGRGHDPSQIPSILSPKSGTKTDLNRSRVERRGTILV